MNLYPEINPFDTFMLQADDLHKIYVEQSGNPNGCLLYTSPSPRDQRGSRMPSSA